MMEAASEIDSLNDRAFALRAIAREARAHGMFARVVGRKISSDTSVPCHVLVIAPNGEILVTRSAERLAKWLGY